jgi:hypothetical protein
MKFSLVYLLLFIESLVIAKLNLSFYSNSLHKLLNFTFLNDPEGVQLVNYDVDPKVFGAIVKKTLESPLTSTSFEIKSVKKINKWNHAIYKSGIYFFEDPESIITFNMKILLDNKFQKTMNFLYFCIDFDGQQLREYTEFDKFFSNHHFLFKNNLGDLEILSVFHFDPEDCEYTKSSKMEVINKFPTKTGKWENQNDFPKKFRNFNGCPLWAAVPQLYPFSHRWQFSNGTVIWDGVTIRLAKLLSWKLNYTAVYLTAELDLKTYELKFDGRVHFLLYMKNIEGTILEACDITDPILLTEWKFFVSPPEIITHFEKMFLAFDETTWSLLLMTVVIGHVVIILINFTRQSWQNFVFGTGIKTPTLNLM